MKYTIVCNQCKAERVVGIVQTRVSETIDWLENEPNPAVAKIVSGRKRLDNNWGWQCICGNNDIMTKQELKKISNPQNPSAEDLESVIKGLVPQKPLFEMRAI